MEHRIELLEQRLNLILWALDIEKCPRGHAYTERLHSLRERAIIKLERQIKEDEVRREYRELKSRLAILEQDYGSILK